MKKALILMLAMLLCLTGFHTLAEEAGEAERETYTCGDFEYALLDDGTAEITKYRGEAEILEIPDELDGYAVIAIGDSAFYGCSGLTSVTLPDSLTAIGYRAFFGCDNATFTVGRDSWAKQYCIDNNLRYTYPDANDWLNN